MVFPRLLDRFFFSFQNNHKNLDPSHKTDLDFWDFFRKGKTCIIAKFHRADLVFFVVILESGKL